MIVTGVQPVGAKGVNTVQVAAIDSREVSRSAKPAHPETDPSAPQKAGEPQPVVFPRAGLGLDQRPVELRHQYAAARYKEDGGAGDDSGSRDHDSDG